MKSWTRWASITLLVASAMTTLTVMLHPEVSPRGEVNLSHLNEGLTLWNFVHALVLIDAFLWLCAGVLVAVILFEKQARQAVVGAILTGIGSLGLAAIGASEIVIAKVAAGTSGSPSPALATQFDGANAIIYLLPAVAMLTVGLAVLAYGLWASRLVRGVIAATFVVGTVLSNPPIPRVANILGQLLQLAAAVVIYGHLSLGGWSSGTSRAANTETSI